jgi:uncharacterized protein (DUF2225 family)
MIRRLKITRREMMSSKSTKFLVIISAASLAVFFASVPDGDSHTFTTDVVTCPVCGEKVTIRITTSMYVSKTLMDFQRVGAVGTYYDDLIVSCPVCHFSGYVSDFSREIEDDVKKKVMTELKPKAAGRKLRGFEECEFAAKIYIWQKRRNKEIAHIYLIGSYLLRRAKGDLEQKRKGFQEKAGDYFMKALTADEFEATERGVISYLIGELYRRIGEFQKALFWYDRALKEKENPDWLEGFVEKQQELAKNKDPNNDI